MTLSAFRRSSVSALFVCTLIALLCGAWPSVAQDTAGVGEIRGTVADASGRPAADVAVCVAGSGRCEVSAADGRFAIAAVRAGTYQLEILAPNRPSFLSQDVEVRAGLESAVEIILPDIGTVQQSVTVTAPAFIVPEEITTSGYLVSSQQVLASAGALQDVARFVQSLPGAVIGTDDFRNDLIVRGGSPLENLYIVDNIEIPNINTFATFASAGGTVSILDAALLQDVTFLTGGFSAAYGNRASSVLQVTQREGSRTGFAGRATVGFAGVGGVLEGPIGRKRAGSWVVSARRSFLDLVTDDVGIGGVPVLYTFNGKAVYDVSPLDRIWLVNVSGVDNIRLGLTATTDITSELSNLDIRYSGQRSATGFNWQRLFGTRGVGLFGLTYARAKVSQRVSDLIRNGIPPPGTPIDAQIAAGTVVFREDSTESEITAKYDLTAYLPLLGKLQSGINVKRSAVNYDTASPFGTDSPFFTTPDVNPFILSEQVAPFQVGTYVQSTRAIRPRLNVTIGGRLDHFHYLRSTRLSPRLGLTLRASNRLSLRGSYGQYPQQPFFLFVAAYPENRSLSPFRADHIVGGATYDRDPSTRFSVEVYRKTYRDYPVSRQIPSLSLANVGDTFAIRDVLFPMVSAGRGTAKGVELLAERKTGAGRWQGHASIAFSRTRYAGLDGVLRPGTFDYPVVVNVVGGYRLSSRWDVATRVAYLGGRPFTPFDVTTSEVQRRGVFDVTQVNARRAPDYFRLDLRVDRRLTIAGREVSFFAGVQNATNRSNVAGFGWDRRANTSRVNEQLGIFPILGLDWRF